MALVNVEIDGNVCIVTLANQAKRNALSRTLLDDLQSAIHAATDAGSRAVVLRAEPGVAIWSSGHDISELPGDGSDPLSWANPLESCFRTMRHAPYPIIAAVEGSVWGGATELVLSCDLVVAVVSSSFAITPAKLGIPYNSEGVARFIDALPVNLAREMFFTAEPVSAAVWHAHGVVNRLVGDEAELTATARALADRIASLSPLAINAIKAEFTTLTNARAVTSEQFERLTSARQAAWRSDDYREAIAAFREHRSMTFRGL